MTRITIRKYDDEGKAGNYSRTCYITMSPSTTIQEAIDMTNWEEGYDWYKLIPTDHTMELCYQDSKSSASNVVLDNDVEMAIAYKLLEERKWKDHLHLTIIVAEDDESLSIEAEQG